MMGIITKYSNFYGGEIPENPIEIIKCIPKEELLATVGAVNARLKPLYNSYFDDSRDTQIDCLKVVFLDNKNTDEESNCRDFISALKQLPGNHTLFTRVTCLYAFQEILSNDDFVEETPEYTLDLRERIFKFLLIVNENILLFNNTYNDKDREELGSKFFEFFMFKELPHNQYYTSSNSINLFYKSWCLFQALDADTFFSQHLKIYLKETFDVDEMSDFFKHQMYSYFKSYDDNLKLQYINISVNEENESAIKILD